MLPDTRRSVLAELQDAAARKWPGCFQVGNVLYMHPELIAKLPSAA